MQTFGIETWMLYTLPPVLLAALFLVSKSLRALAWVAAVMLLLASISPHKPWNADRFSPTWILPLQMKRSMVFFVFGAILAFGTLVQARKLVGTKFPLIAGGALLIGLYMGLLRIVHEGPQDAIETTLGAILTVFSLGFAATATTQDRGGMLNLLRSIALAGLGWVGLVAVQFVLNRSLITVPQPPRFIGLGTNPQATAIMLGPIAVTLLWLAMNDPWRLARLVWYPVLGMFLMMILWTGSRTGAGMFVLGAVFVTYARLGRVVFLLPVIAVVLLLLLELMKSAGIEVSDRVTSTENTRGDVWARLFSSALGSPIIGVGQGKDLGSENSFLLGFAAYGIVMLGAILLFTGLIVWTSVRLLRARRVLPESYRPYVDICHGYFAAYLFGAIFEGYMLARVATNLVLILLFAGLAARLIWVARSIEAGVPAVDDVELSESGHVIEPEPEALDWGEQSAGGWGAAGSGASEASYGEYGDFGGARTV